ncbi:MAG: DUF3515 domain-containing protein [Pseudonocardiales bacterium]|nr:DUF3515 domain-containing protein [Actinomycetota bacterium]
MPVVVILALVLGRAANHPGHSGSSRPPAPRALAPVTVAAPPADPGSAASCTTLLTALPVQLGALAPRVVHPEPDSPFVVAWGDPAVVLRCGVVRPAALKPGSADLLVGVDGVFWLPIHQSKSTVWITVDRPVYIEVSVPESYRQPPLAPIADAVAKVMRAVCVVDPTQTDPSTLCTNRR